MLKHKILGQVFTPNWIVEEILNSINFLGDNIIGKKIIDPACGDGAFLKNIVRRIIVKCVENNFDNEKIIEILENSVYGIEIDNVEFHNCIKNLDNIIKEELNKNVSIKWKIFNDNTLYKYKDFIDFFDFVVGNPPYIRIHNLDKETRKLIKDDFIFSDGTIDIYIVFFELGFKILNKNGKLGYITPNSYLHNSSYINFRKYLKNKNAIKELIDFKSNKIFSNFSTYTAISIINFFEKNTTFEYKELIDNKIEKINTINYKELSDKDWSFTNYEDMTFLKEIYLNTNKKVSDYFDVQYGFATLRDGIYINNIEEEKDNLVLFNNYWIEKSILHKIVKGSTYKGKEKDIKYIIFPYKMENSRYIPIVESELMEKYPNTYKYLLDNKEELLKRDIDKGALWYEFGRSQGIQTSHNDKIVISTLIKDDIKYYELGKDIFVYSGIFIIKKSNKSNWEIIKSIFNSQTFLKYIKITGKDFSGGYKSITSNQIKNFPTNEINNQKTLFNL